MLKFLKLTAFFALVLTLSLATASATVVSLADLIANDGSIQVGDKLFSNFSFSNTCNGPGVCAPPNASGINVEGVQNGDLIGLRFSGGIVVTGGLQNGFTIGDWLLGYSAVVVGTDNLISDMHLAFNGSYSGPMSQATVTETIFEGGTTNIIGQLTVTNPPQVLSREVDLTKNVPAIDVKKDIRLSVYGTFPSYADLSFVDQYLSQTPGGEVPEPGTYALMGAGLIGLAFLRRRKA